MNSLKRYFITAAAVALTAVAVVAQDTSTSTLRRGSRRQAKEAAGPKVTQRMSNRMATVAPSDADLQWMRVIYRELDLNKEANAPLYYPEDLIDGQENMFRLLMRLLASGQIPAYEYLDGREDFSDKYRVKVKDLLDRFHIVYKDAKGSTEKNPRFEIHESDVPTTEVLSYYVIERWEFDKRSNKTRTVVEAICPVLHRSDDWGMEAVKYPMFWVKFSDLRPYLSAHNIFTSDANNLATSTYDDFFQLNLYKGDIFKTRNLRNRSLVQMFPNADERRHAQDSIQKSLERFDNNLWVPSLEELQAMREKKVASDSTEVESASGDSKLAERKITTRRGSKDADRPAQKASKPKSVKKQSSGVVRSVRNNRRR